MARPQEPDDDIVTLPPPGDKSLCELMPDYRRLQASTDRQRKVAAQQAIAEAERKWRQMRDAEARMLALDPRATRKEQAADLRASVERSALAALTASMALYRVVQFRPENQDLAGCPKRARSALAQAIHDQPWSLMSTPVRSDIMGAAYACYNAKRWEQGKLFKSVVDTPKVVVDAKLYVPPPPTSPELEAASRWWHGQGFAPQPKPGYVVIEIDAQTTVLDKGSRIDVVGEITDDAMRLMCLRALEFKNSPTLDNDWEQADVDRIHVMSSRLGLKLRYSDVQPSPAAIAEAENAADAKATMRQDVKDGERLLAYLAGQHIDDESLRAFANTHGDDVHADLAAMLPLQLAAAARVARVEGARLLVENPDAGKTIERVRDVGMSNKQAGDEPMKYIPGGNGG